LSSAAVVTHTVVVVACTVVATRQDVASAMLATNRKIPMAFPFGTLFNM
jgi:hypothetical protein